MTMKSLLPEYQKFLPDKNFIQEKKVTLDMVYEGYNITGSLAADNPRKHARYALGIAKGSLKNNLP